MLLEKIDSPFVREGEIMINPADGSPIMNAKGKPQRKPVMPTIEEIVQSFFVLQHQGRPDILQILRMDGFEQVILEFGASLTMEKVKAISAEINSRFTAMNEASGPGDGSPKKVDGSTQPLEPSSLPQAEALSK